jgi:hypothetical protein
MIYYELIEKIILMITSFLAGGLMGYFFSLKIEEYKFYIYQRQQAEKIAELFAKWIKYNGQSDKFLNDKERIDYYEQLNKLTWELAMWIPNEQLVKKIMVLLSNAQNALNIKEIIIETRGLILQKKTKDSKWQDLIHFTKREK